MTIETELFRDHITLIALELNTTKGAGGWLKVEGGEGYPTRANRLMREMMLADKVSSWDESLGSLGARMPTLDRARTVDYGRDALEQEERRIGPNLYRIVRLVELELPAGISSSCRHFLM